MSRAFLEPGHPNKCADCTRPRPERPGRGLFLSRSPLSSPLFRSTIEGTPVLSPRGGSGHETMRFAVISSSVLALLLAAAAAQTSPAVANPGHAAPPSLTFDQFTDQLIRREQDVFKLMRNLHPIAETYVQDTRPDAEMGIVPVRDQYF